MQCKGAEECRWGNKYRQQRTIVGTDGQGGRELVGGAVRRGERPHSDSSKGCKSARSLSCTPVPSRHAAAVDLGVGTPKSNLLATFFPLGTPPPPLPSSSSSSSSSHSPSPLRLRFPCPRSCPS